MQKVIRHVIFTLFLSQTVWAQAVLFEDKNNYMQDLKVLLGATKNQSVINLGTKFESEVWSNNAFDEIDKQKITEISKKMLDKKYVANGPFTLMLASLMAAVQNPDIGSDLMVHYIETLSLTVDYQDVNVLNDYFKVSTLFFRKRALFDYYNNSCTIRGGTFDFIYAGVLPLTPDQNGTAAPGQGALSIPASGATPILMGAVQPTVEGPSIKFDNIDISLGSRFDSALIHNTAGSFMFSNKLFVGNRGKFDWSLLGQDVAEIYVDFKEYNFNTTTNVLTAENVEFFYPSKFESSVIGLFEFKSARRASANAAQYPKFTSLTNNVQLDHLSKNIGYTGGFSLAGKQFSSKCLDNKPASLAYNDGRNRFQAFANNFNFGDSVITADPASIIIFIDRDTIWHPGVAFTLRTGTQTVRFHRDRGAYKNSLWHDTYHKLEFSVDLINWDLKSDSMNFDIYAAKSQIPAMFKSMNYFSDREFTKLQVINNFHPLRLLFGYMKSAKTDKLISEEILKKNKNLTPAALAGAMIDLERKGFVYYDENSGEIILRPKAFHYMQSFIGKSDYDGIYLPSLSPEEVNATLDTKEFVLKIRGVERFYISDSSNVYAIPDNKTVKIYNNREIQYDGRLIAGIFDMKGKNFRFNYEDFLVSMEKIDTIKFIMKDDKKDKDKKGKDSYLDNNMVNASGTMYVNSPDNKSGKKSLPQYPKFDAATGAYVYFNSKKILGGAYNREVYFKIPPFKTDSVKGSDKKAVKFEGEFSSGGILPDFKETLKIMPDNALGFRHKVPAEGYDVYGGKAKFFGSISLDHQGIRGDGELKYLSSTFYSNDFVFYPDSIIAVGQQAKIKEQTISDVYYPDVDIADYEMKWIVKDDSMHLININNAFELYKKSITLEGTLNLTPRGLFGAGMMEIKKVNVIASHFEFGHENIGARHAVFNSKLPGNPKPSLSVNNAHINFNLKDSYADLNPEAKGLASMDFPINQFKTSIENARWDMNKKIVTMSADENDISKSFFYSTNPEDDSLVFNGANATYDMVKNLLHIEGVPFIKVFDTQIVPDSNAVTVYEGAQLKTFKNAKLVIDTLNGYHHLDRGKIEIISRNKFIGSAHYAFVNSGGDTMNIMFENFYTDFKKAGKKDSIKYTSSEAFIKDGSKFYIAPKILYKGKAKLIAPNKLLAFDGKVKIDIKAKGLKTDWFPYQNDGSSGDVVILLEKPKDTKTKQPVTPALSEGGGAVEDSTTSEEEDLYSKLHTGLFYETGSNELYSTIVSTKRNETDEEIFSASGQLIFDTHTNSFKIGPSKRLKDEAIAGNLYTYNDTSSILTAGGKFSLIKNDANFSMTSIGESKGSITRNSFAANLLVSLKMNMPPKALNIMAKKIQEIFEMAPAVVIDSATQHEESMMMAKIANLENDKVAREFDKNFTEDAIYRPLFRYSSKLVEGICIANVHMNWSNQHKVWHNKTHLKLSNILETDINNKMKGYLEVKKSDQGDVVTLFLHPRSDVWYFIKYEPGRLSLLSSETDFMRAVTEKSKGESGTPAIYTFVQADFTEKQAFLKEFWKDYLGKEYNEEEEEKEVEEQVEADPDAIPAEITPALEATPTLEAEPGTEVPVKGKKKEKKPKAKKDDITQDPNIEQPVQEEVTPIPVEATPEGENTTEPKREKKPVKKKKTDITKEETAVTPEPVEATPAPVEATPAPVEATPIEATPEGENTSEPKKKEKAKKPVKKKKTDITQEETEVTPEPVEATPTPVEATPALEATPEGESTGGPVKKKEKEKKPSKKKARKGEGEAGSEDPK